MVKSKLHGGDTKALVLTCKSKKSSYSFIFTYLVSSSPRLFNSVQMILRAYDSTRQYRDLRVRSPNLITNDALTILPHEEVYDQLDGVWNLSGDKGELGVFISTNVRNVWYSSIDPKFNVSIPFYVTSTITIKKSKFGQALVVKTTATANSLSIGFRIDPKEKLEKTHRRINRLFRLFHSAPIYGVDFDRSFEDEEEMNTIHAVPFQDDDIEITHDQQQDILAAYVEGKLRGDDNGSDAIPVYNEELGLAVEPLQEGFTLSDLLEISHD
eukprot:m.5774 g.5774  ORF g.5774 m.5774 type:complete len:269 (-) comp2474_c0_seq1:275-1081(-)